MHRNIMHKHKLVRQLARQPAHNDSKWTNIPFVSIRLTCHVLWFIILRQIPYHISFEIVVGWEMICYSKMWKWSWHFLVQAEIVSVAWIKRQQYFKGFVAFVCQHHLQDWLVDGIVQIMGTSLLIGLFRRNVYLGSIFYQIFQ